MTSYTQIMSYLSSSDINRCKRNGLMPYGSYTVEEWLNYFNQQWINRKLRRKLYTLYRLDILSIKREPFVFVSDNYQLGKEISHELDMAMEKLRDKILLGGKID